ncbi:MAG: nickel pincer cofactor biosynthesis protein LarC, partial [Acidobacteria bacterium]|nr:nickel pincer cofactor biosynthesis protein LarC [Acidobacteriota bacterium]
LGVEGYDVSFENVDRSGISATRAVVRTRHEHAHRHLGDILKIIYQSRLSDGVKDRAARIFSRLAEAEARVHNVPVERIHFHEVGALDAIIDVVGACIGFELLGVERFASSALHVGSGMVEMAHGRFPVPPPAVAELLKNAPVYSTDITGELLTPTGAAIISTVCDEFGQLPRMLIERTGYGAGSREYQNFPNALRLILGRDEAAQDEPERLLMIETNIDDMSPQHFGYLMEKVIELGALDCYFTPVQMKKNRPGVLVSILCRKEQREALQEILFAETTTLGLRSYEVERRALQRESVRVETPYGEIDVKVASINGRVVNEKPEYEQCRAAAERAGVALRTVEAAALKALQKD